MWHYARGVAFAARNQTERADDELEALLKIAAMPEMEKMTLNNATGTHILNIAAAIVAGEAAAKAGDTDKSVEHLSKAVQLQDDLSYMEPPTWHYPVRQSLGAVLLDAGRLEDAEAVYWESLENWPDNGWSLFGLLQTLRAQGRTREAPRSRKAVRKSVVPRRHHVDGVEILNAKERGTIESRAPLSLILLVLLHELVGRSGRCTDSGAHGGSLLAFGDGTNTGAGTRRAADNDRRSPSKSVRRPRARSGR